MNNYPPGAASDPRAPYNQPDPLDLFPVYCNECGFKANHPGEMRDHEHSKNEFSRMPPGYEPPKCAVCNDFVDDGRQFCDDCKPNAVPDEQRDDYNINSY